MLRIMIRSACPTGFFPASSWSDRRATISLMAASGLGVPNAVVRVIKKPRAKKVDKHAAFLIAIANNTCIVLIPGFTGKQMKRRLRKIAKRLNKETTP